MNQQKLQSFQTREEGNKKLSQFTLHNIYSLRYLLFILFWKILEKCGKKSVVLYKFPQ